MTPATKANMRAERKNGPPSDYVSELVAVDTLGQQYSANPRDYFWLADEEQALTDAQGTPLVLAWVDPRYTGPASHGYPIIEYV